MTPAPSQPLDPALLLLLLPLLPGVRRLLRQACLPLASSVTPTRRHPSLVGPPDSLSRAEV